MRGIEGVKVGDTLKCMEGFSRRYSLFKVVRLTKTQASCEDGTCFKIETGLKIGTGQGWGRVHANIATADDITKIAYADRVRAAQHMIRLLVVSSENLEAVEALLKATKAGE